MMPVGLNAINKTEIIFQWNERKKIPSNTILFA